MGPSESLSDYKTNNAPQTRKINQQHLSRSILPVLHDPISWSMLDGGVTYP